MSAKTKTDIIALDTAFKESAKVSAPMVARLGTHRDIVALAVKSLEMERSELQSKLDEARRQFEALEEGIGIHLADVDAVLSMYENGLHSLPADSSKDGLGM